MAHHQAQRHSWAFSVCGLGGSPGSAVGRHQWLVGKVSSGGRSPLGTPAAIRTRCNASTSSVDRWLKRQGHLAEILPHPRRPGRRRTQAPYPWRNSQVAHASCLPGAPLRPDTAAPPPADSLSRRGRAALRAAEEGRPPTRSRAHHKRRQASCVNANAAAIRRDPWARLERRSSRLGNPAAPRLRHRRARLPLNPTDFYDPAPPDDHDHEERDPRDVASKIRPPPPRPSDTHLFVDEAPSDDCSPQTQKKQAPARRCALDSVNESDPSVQRA